MAGLIAAAQAVEHYEITRYGTLLAWAVGLMALKVVDRGPDRVPGLLLRTDRVDHIAQHREGLERDHDLVVLGEVADQKQDLLGCHWALLSLALPPRDQVRPSVGFLERPRTRLSATQ